MIFEHESASSFTFFLLQERETIGERDICHYSFHIRATENKSGAKGFWAKLYYELCDAFSDLISQQK